MVIFIVTSVIVIVNVSSCMVVGTLRGHGGVRCSPQLANDSRRIVELVGPRGLVVGRLLLGHSAVALDAGSTLGMVGLGCPGRLAGSRVDSNLVFRLDFK